MSTIRRLLLTRPALVALLCTAMLALRLLVPVGYMLAEQQGRIAIIVCPGVTAQTIAHMAMPGHDTHEAPAGHDRSAEGVCAFAGLSAPMLGAIDVVLLVVALALVAAAVLRRVPDVTPCARLRLRPPLRAPPLSA